MQNFKDHYQDIIREYVDYWFAQYMKGQWGIEVGYPVLPWYWIDIRKQLCDYQVMSTCGDLCEQSRQ